MMRRLGLSALILLVALPLAAQGPPIGAIVAQAKQTTAFAAAAAQETPEYKAYIKTDEYKAYVSARAVQMALEQLEILSAKPATPAPDPSSDSTLNTEPAPPAGTPAVKAPAKKN